LSRKIGFSFPNCSINCVADFYDKSSTRSSESLRVQGPDLRVPRPSRPCGIRHRWALSEPEIGARYPNKRYLVSHGTSSRPTTLTVGEFQVNDFQYHLKSSEKTVEFRDVAGVLGGGNNAALFRYKIVELSESELDTNLK